MPDNIRMLFRTDSGVQVINLQTMKQEMYLEAPGKLTPAITLSPNGEILAWALEDNTIQLIRMTDQKLLHTLIGHTDRITRLKFSPKGDKLFSSSQDTWVRLWDSNGNQVQAFQPTGADNNLSAVLGMGISPDGTMLATIPSDGPVKLWNTADYKLERDLGGSGGYDTSDVAFSTDGQMIAADLAAGLFLWRITDGMELLGSDPRINSMAVAFSPDGRTLAYSEIGERNAIVLSSADGTQRIRTLEGQQTPVWGLIFSPDSTLLASIDDVETRVWRVEDGELLLSGKDECH
jgi:WD40 repeat protein